MNSFIGQKYLEKIAGEKVAECSRFPTGTIQDIMAARVREAAKNVYRPWKPMQGVEQPDYQSSVVQQFIDPQNRRYVGFGSE